MMIAAMAVGCLTASAQNEVGQITLQPKVGINIANITGAKTAVTNTSVNVDANYMVDFAAGAEAEYGLTEKISLAAGLIYSRQGCDFGEFNTTILGVKSGWDKNQTKLAYLNIPIVANYYFAKGIAFKAGIQPGFLLSKKKKIDAYGSNLSFETEIKEDLESFDFSIPLGISYESDNVVIDGRYNLGVTKINKKGNESYKNSVIQFTIGYKFTL